MNNHDSKIIPLPISRWRHDHTLSIVVPFYNEEEVLLSFHTQLEKALHNTPMKNFEVIYVNDGSRDASPAIARELARENAHVMLIDLSRNFGKEAALTAGLDQTTGDAVIFIDADLQDPPSLIPEMVSFFYQGYDVVNMKRTQRDGETRFKKWTARMFYRLMARLGPVEMPENVGDFRLLSRRAVDALKTMPERNRFMKGLFAWIGFRVKEVGYQRDPRYAGTTKWNYWGLTNLAVEGITSYTVVPLRLASYFGGIVSLGAFAYGLFIFLRTLMFGDSIQGFPTLILVILFLGGVQLLSIGIVGEYLGKIFMETKQRPLYIIREIYGIKNSIMANAATIMRGNFNEAARR